MMRRVLVTMTVGLLLLLVLVPESTNARPSGGVYSRKKRVSDQRLAELETLMALARLKGKLVTVPIGFGRVDPAKIGRKRRSTSGINIQNLRFLQSVLQASESDDDDSSELLPAFWFQKDAQDRRGEGMEDPSYF